MNAYVTKLADRWVMFVQSPIGIYVELRDYCSTKEAAIQRLKDLRFTVVLRPLPGTF